jgi:hypothetical protein
MSIVTPPPVNELNRVRAVELAFASTASAGSSPPPDPARAALVRRRASRRSKSIHSIDLI